MPRFTALVCAALLLPTFVHAETPAEKGLRIAKEVDVANSGYKGETSTMEMVLINAHGDETKRKMDSKILEMTDDGDRSIITFEWPADVKGTRMLTWSHKVGNDDQWLYLPSLKRVRRISSRNKSGAFMGSEFAYEDLGSQEVEKYQHTWLRDEQVDGRDHWVLQRIPVDKRSGYSKQIVWTDKERKQATRIEFYDRKGDKLKTFELKGFAQYGEFWRPATIEATNHQTKKRSILKWADRKLGDSPDADAFDKDNLEGW